MAPEKFWAILDQKTFTNGADCAMVKEKYAKTFEEVLGSAEVLDFKSLNWGAKEFEVVAEALPACHALKELQLDFNNPGKGGKGSAPSSTFPVLLIPRCSPNWVLKFPTTLSRGSGDA